MRGGRVAGSVRILKSGEVLFRTGDSADSMFIVRRGSLKVYALKDNEEIQLALLGDGAIVGEMAFFDRKPRSAHVRALTQTEITEISRADFDKLLTQIPKWLVSMLQSLSGRLRTTNEKLLLAEKAIQGRGGDSEQALVPLVRSLRILQLITLQLGQKDGSHISFDFNAALEWWMMLTGWSRDYFQRFISTLQNLGVIQRRGEGSQRIVLSGRPKLQAFTEFVGELQPRAGGKVLDGLSSEWVELFEAALAEAQDSGYESYNVSFAQLARSPALAGRSPAQKSKAAAGLAQLLALKHSQSDSDFIVKMNVKSGKNQLIFLNMLLTCLSNKLDRLD